MLGQGRMDTERDSGWPELEMQATGHQPAPLASTRSHEGVHGWNGGLKGPEEVPICLLLRPINMPRLVLSPLVLEAKMAQH